MEQWKTAKVSDIGRIVTGKTPRTAVAANYGGSIPFLTPSDDMSVKYIHKTTKTLTETGLQEVKNTLLPTNSVCVSCIGSDLGKVIITTEPTVTNQQINSIIVDTEKFDVSFVYYAMIILGKELNFISKTSTAVPIVNKSSFSSYEIKCPSLKTQRRIASVLTSLDDKIEVNNEINYNLEQQAKLAFRDLLNSCSGQITIGEISQNILDYTPNTNAMVKLLNSSDVTDGVFPNTAFVPNNNLKGHFKKRFCFGDVLYSEIRPRNHHYGIALFDTSDYIASTRLMIIRAISSKISPVMLYQYLLLPEVEAEFTLKTESRSGTFPQGNYADMASIVVPYELETFRGEISALLLSIRNEIAHNQRQNQDLIILRDSILPKLMSGEFDVSGMDI